ncbi:MAG TPA: TetR/AcrR family transcriptional regulator [Caulobacteraceae bacterium]|nr:TetR/AcrR family transcriptional regulator [Caulobacteraceae bacterium]
MGRREEAKEERRERIIRAARELIRQTGDAGLSMRVLARTAGVSLTTPYNLFGSKRAIVLGALQDVQPFAEAMEKLAGADPLARIFAAARIATGLYEADPDFYRPMFVALFDISGGEEYRSLFGPSRHAFWRGLVEEAVAAGQLETGFDLDLFTSQIEQIFLSALLRWVTNEIPAEAMGPSVGYGFSLMLSGVAREGSRADLAERRRAFEGELAS